MLVYTLLTLFICSYFLHFTSRFPFLGALRFDLLLGLVLLLSIFLNGQKDKWRKKIPVGQKMLFFLAYIVASLPLVTWPGSVLRFNLIPWVKVAMFFLFIVALIRTEKQLRWILAIFLITQTFRILEPLYLHLTTGYWGDVAYSMVGGTLSRLDRLSGAPHDIVNPNQLAWVTVNTIPFLYYFLWKGGKFSKILSLLAAPFFLYTLLLTGSRSGILSLLFVFLAMVFMTKRRLKNMATAALITLPVAIYAIGNLGSGMQTRYLSLIDDTVAGSDTVHGRIVSSINQLKTLSSNPLFGNGLGTSRETNANIMGGRAQVTHNLYIEILQEVGIIGFILFSMFVIAMLKSLTTGKRLIIAQGFGEDDPLYRILLSLQAWIFMQLFYSLSCFGLSSWEWYFFGGIATVCLALAQERAEATQKASMPETSNISEHRAHLAGVK